MNRGPIYLAGIERSGTSLMYALLASHPNIAMTRRTNLWTYFNNQFGNLNNAENLQRCLSIMSQYKRLRAIQIDTERVRREFYQGEKTYARLFSLVEGHFAERLGKPRWGDKSLNTERYMDDIFAAFPNAKIIHMMRDPRDRYASAKTRWTDMKGRVGAGTAMWLESVKLARRGQRKYPGQYKVVRYEDLVAQPEQTVRTICEFLGEEYIPEMLTMIGAPTHRNKGSNSSYGKREVGQISTDSIARYRQVLSRQEIKYMEDFCRNGMREFGYTQDDIRLSPREQLNYLFVDWPFNFVRMSFWTIKETVWGIKGRRLPARRLVPNKKVVQAS
jgi:sulfotransferase family protein